jgi:hypothetical protein
VADLDDTLDSVAAGPSSVSGDAGSVSAQPLTDLIALDKHKAAKAGAAKKGRGIRFTKLIHPGPTGTSNRGS